MLLAVGDVAFADLYRETLVAAGWQVDAAHDWRSTEELLLKSTPDVVVLDGLPDIRQIDALENIRRRTKQLLVVFLTDTLEVGDLERAKELGVQAFLIKTRATREMLPETLGKLLQSRSSADLTQS